MNYFTMGYWVLILALGVSAAGAVVGLACIRQSTLSVTARFRMVWLTAAAVSIGGVGTWLAVYVSMLGLGVSSGEIRYGVTAMVAAVILSALSVLAGLVIAGRDAVLSRIAGGGAVMGIGLGIAHRLAMGAVGVQGSVSVNIWLSVAAAAVAIAASIGLLWATMRYRSMIVLAGVAVVYAVAVTALHYIGQAGVDVQLDPTDGPPAGDDLFTLFVPVFVMGTLSLAIPITAVLVAPDRSGTAQSRRGAGASRADQGGTGRRGAARPADRTPQPAS